MLSVPYITTRELLKGSNNMEIWKDIKGYEGEYQVSNLGNVKSLERYMTKPNRWGGQTVYFHKEKQISKNLCKGYYKVHLYKDTEREIKSVHRLVAEAFLPNPNNLAQVNHKDENKLNNNVDNLEWCTHEYNMAYGTGRIRAGQKHINLKALSKPVMQYTKDGKLVNTYPSIAEAGRQLGVCSRSIGQVANARKGTAYGYQWRFVNEVVV